MATSCSGVPAAPHESTFRQINDVIRALATPPEFICFLGDEIIGLTTSPDDLRAQWRYFFEREMAWLDRESISLYHVTGNHTVYNKMSESVFREAMAHLPLNGPKDQCGLSYTVRRGDLLLIFVNTLHAGTGGEGTVETDWLERILEQHCDARHKLVCGHHPVWTVNGYAGDYQRAIVRENGRRFWEILARHGVVAYACSHILAFDVQAHEGVLQICTAGAGTAHRMPLDTEYLHFAQAALDEKGLRYQVLDRSGNVREWLAWDMRLPSSESWMPFKPRSAQRLAVDCLSRLDPSRLVVWEIAGQMSIDAGLEPQTLLCAHTPNGVTPWLWLGVSGANREITALLSPAVNRSPHRWCGPALPSAGEFSIQFAIHSGMGAGGLLWRWSDDHHWSSMVGASAWGVERLHWSHDWTIGRGGGQRDFLGRDLRVKWHHVTYHLYDYVRQHPQSREIKLGGRC